MIAQYRLKAGIAHLKINDWLYGSEEMRDFAIVSIRLHYRFLLLIQTVNDTVFIVN